MELITDETLNSLLSETMIMNYAFNLYENTVEFFLGYNENNILKRIHVCFNEVKAYQFIADCGEMTNVKVYKKSFDDWYFEFSCITILNETKTIWEGNADEKEWLSQYKPEYNIAIEMGLSILLLNCSSVTINDNVYSFDTLVYT